MKTILSLMFGFVVVFASTTSYASEKWHFLDMPGTACKARSPSDESGLRYGYDGKLWNVSNDMIKVVCSFQLRDSNSKYYGAYVYGNAQSDEYRWVTCKLWVRNTYTGERHSKSALDAGGHGLDDFRMYVGDVKGIKTVAGINVATLECMMDPKIFIGGIRFFTSYDTL